MAGVRHGKRGGKNGKNKKAITRKNNGYYARQAIRTEINRKRKQAKHLRKQQKKLLRKR